MQKAKKGKRQAEGTGEMEKYENFDEGMEKELGEDSLDGIIDDASSGIPEDIFRSFERNLDSFDDRQGSF